MQPLEALRLEGLRLRGRVGIVDGRRGHVAELQAHALAVLEVDGGKQDHRRRYGFHRRKLAISARPSAWLFSGMELRARDIAARHGGRDRAAIVGDGQHIVVGASASR